MDQREEVIYIPKKPKMLAHREFNPLNMLEALYKIHSRVLVKRLSLTFHIIIGDHQHRFIADKGIKEPSHLRC